MALLASAVLFAVFMANVVMGSLGDAFLSNVSEMLVLFMAAVAFVVAILRYEAAAQK